MSCLRDVTEDPGKRLGPTADRVGKGDESECSGDESFCLPKYSRFRRSVDIGDIDPTTERVSSSSYLVKTYLVYINTGVSFIGVSGLGNM